MVRVAMLLVLMGASACAGGPRHPAVDRAVALMIELDGQGYTSRNLTSAICPVTLDELDAMGQSSHPDVSIERRSIALDARFKTPGSQEIALSRKPRFLFTQTLVINLADDDCSAWVYLTTL